MTQDALWEVISESWNNIKLEVIHKLVESMPQRVMEVLKGKGGHTKY